MTPAGALTTEFEYDTAAEACNLTDVLHQSRPVTLLFYGLIFIFGCVGNLLVIFTITWRRQIRCSGDVYFVNLALADLMFVCTLPLWMQYLLNHDSLASVPCTVLTACFYVAMFASLCFITEIALDRYYAIVYMKYRPVKQAVFASVFWWLFAFIIAIPHFMVVTKKQNQCMNDYEQLERSYPIILKTEIILGAFVIPLSVISYCHYQISKVVAGSQSRHKTHVMRVLLAVVCVFILFWMPYHLALFVDVLRLLHWIPDSCEFTKSLQKTLILTESVAFCHCCFNPLLYVFVGTKFRQELYLLLGNLRQRLFSRAVASYQTMTFSRRSSRTDDGTTQDTISETFSTVSELPY
ncbi:envelope protein US28 [Panine betaherpesvirus 2]|uniref:Envelope protein US28 n=1 Tax=Panine betaherpesvirus 2 TaxID=188763 RepID=Q8QRT2_9BETA|nr:envelope protein US28 [Panine betaherpesvirus 2]AAM00806.1 envelope protein US28 [Panine betaherpesvirus 2]QXV67924.1 envelope protein US28 [Panine betaherpesvirus 2]